MTKPKNRPPYSAAQVKTGAALSTAYRELAKLPPEQYAGPPATHRTFESGATRDLDDDKLDFEGFLSAPALQAFAEYMHAHRRMKDGSIRASDNWQSGFPADVLMKSAWRHFFAVWSAHRAGKNASLEDLCGLFFNAQGMLHEAAKSKEAKP